MADMTGWKEIGEKVAEIYSNLTQAEQNNCAVFCYHYGQAGAVMFYGKKVGIPQPISYNGSFVFWSPDKLDKDFVILIHFDDDNPDEPPDDMISSWFKKVELKATIENPNFREKGTLIYFCSFPTEATKQRYREEMAVLKGMYRN
jgi:hypothetical protein